MKPDKSKTKAARNAPAKKPLVVLLAISGSYPETAGRRACSAK